jgi:prepilin signal peptidase PulO-like enzyme (type II secretory pathway)
MTVVFAIVLVVHGLIHVLGFVKAFGLAELRQLTQPVSPSLGALWLLAALLFLAAAAALFVWPRGWWAIGACAIVVSMFLVVPSWTDAKFGALANLVALIGVVFGFLAQGPASLRAAYERDLERALARVTPAEPIREAEMTVKAAALVPVVQVSGPEMSQGETVTMFNDMCVMAPATLIDPAI